VTEGDPLINLTTTRIGSAAVVTVEGELDLHTARTLMGTVDDTLTTPDLAAIVIDLSGVTFLDSATLHVLIRAKQRNVSMKVVNPSATVLRLLDLTGTRDYLMNHV